ncbi:iron-sulfur cluster assembly accessory protein [Brasilonema sp. UFV-L1]|uniref:HesB/IscA family protein n=1 Tax=Brasilonema sp. UFV-L1 TaxID=2234130 RepID=UPI00145D7B5A|nr:iron-sulfur cluster assembly accessory protein [Brasilonema sp. UFV-L1]NMG05739.1 iron-sulfur cluster assembly accessory protein [Brasilonema sp. UFV-L1]
MIQLSQSAANEIRRLKSKQQQNVLFRLAVKPGGCSGWYYDMSFDRAEHVNDVELPPQMDDASSRSSSDGDDDLHPFQKNERVFECYGIQITIDAESLKYVNNLTLDYSEDLMGGGFRFYNPIANATCGCGNSFSTTSELMPKQV